MAGFTDLVKKTFYLGVGAAAYAGEKATHSLKELQKLRHSLKDLQQQAQILVNDLMERGEITAEEAQRLVTQLVNRSSETSDPSAGGEPRTIEIKESSQQDAQLVASDRAALLQRQVAALRRDLEALRQRSKHR